ncbi:carbamate kinase [Listeria monocytogenes]|uniref:Carbamate kinase n=3 Tax=Listeria monocytogenes TaxID=1639 RepID=B4XQJ6_LISMN|nr:MULTISPECIES: carbamate kinase [Listeria]EAE3705208.1 carbamate kinase [Listeria monocytogenes serotype 1/2b]EAF3076069.1 carbamate kinase [Listeria monocytogenes serotype 1/2a]EAG6253918.1 carbamate kinase [Listeria monocytogenes CFSAN003806]EAG6262837.1 carbamate kinase [Listeria monocytogenes CFSAN003725]EAG6332818.1 carbamate kinase [Listeria monocytogenes CFSAN002346]EAG6350282.1 carbamate kinase [Listeria monocytogenes LIS0102]EAG6365485.1 carbamate kinase [Listeria monocytogenes LI
MNQKIVVALGGNAILSSDASAEAQQSALEKTAEYLVQFIENGDDLIISHGNGPQVGNLMLQQHAGASEKNPAMPLDTCVAMTQGSIGYWMQNALDKAFLKHGLDKVAVSLITQVVVDKDDPAFKKPTKPIGPFLTKEEAEKEMAETGAIFLEDAGRGYRKVVPSPRPLSIKEHQIIKQLVDSGVVTISAGGGGVSVVENGLDLSGVETVIDKDFASEKLAELISADLLVILTGVENVYINYNQPNQKKLERVTVSELEKYIDEKQFAAGSMLPKIEAATAFVKERPNAKAIITSLENIGAMLEHGAGTVIIAG